MVEVSSDICRLFNADRLTLYAVSEDGQSIVSRVKIGLHTSRELKLPISPQSIAGYVALSRRTLNLANAQDEEEIHAISPELHFLREVDRRSGYRTKQMDLSAFAGQTVTIRFTSQEDDGGPTSFRIDDVYVTGE